MKCFKHIVTYKYGARKSSEQNDHNSAEPDPKHNKAQSNLPAAKQLLHNRQQYEFSGIKTSLDRQHYSSKSFPKAIPDKY